MPGSVYIWTGVQIQHYPQIFQLSTSQFEVILLVL